MLILTGSFRSRLILLCFTRKLEYSSYLVGWSPEEHPIDWRGSALQALVHKIHSWTISGHKEKLLGIRRECQRHLQDADLSCCNCNVDNAGNADVVINAEQGQMDVVQLTNHRRYYTFETPDNFLWPGDLIIGHYLVVASRTTEVHNIQPDHDGRDVHMYKRTA